MQLGTHWLYKVLRFDAIIDIKIVLNSIDELALLSSAVLLKAKLALLGDDTAPPECHQRNPKKSTSFGETLTW